MNNSTSKFSFASSFPKHLASYIKQDTKHHPRDIKTINQTSLPVGFLLHFSWFSSTFSPWWHNVYSLLAAVCWCPRNWRWVPDITKLSGSLTIRPTHPRDKQNKDIHKTFSIHSCRKVFSTEQNKAIMQIKIESSNLKDRLCLIKWTCRQKFSIKCTSFEKPFAKSNWHFRKKRILKNEYGI